MGNEGNDSFLDVGKFIQDSCLKTNSHCLAMVKYLGVDYLQKEIDKRRKFLQDAALTVPAHLNLVEEYPHTGKLKDSRYRQPWDRAFVDSSFLKNEAAGYNADLVLLTEGIVEKTIELYGSEKTLTCEGNFELCLASPKSTCSSSDLFDSQDCISELSEEKDTYDNETFQKVDLSSFASAACTDLSLEETICENFLHHNVKALPDLHTLCSHINPKQVKDPLSEAAKSLFTSLESVGYEENRSEQENVKTEGDIQPYDLSDYILSKNERYLEECILPSTIMAEVVDTETIYKVLDISEVQPEEMNSEEKQDACEVVKHLGVPDSTMEIFEDANQGNSFEIISFKDLIAQDRYALDMLNMVSLEPDMNKDDTKFSFMDKFIESPVTDINRQFTPQKFQSSEELQLILVDNSSQNQQLLTHSEREKFAKVVWEHEKFMCDLLPLRLPEPETDTNIDYSWILHTHILKQFTQGNVCSINLTQLEMDLQWDPLYDMNLKSDKNVETIQLDLTAEDMEKIKPVNEICSEPYTKFSSAELNRGWQDGYIRDTNTESSPSPSSKSEEKSSILKKPNTTVEAPPKYPTKSPQKQKERIDDDGNKLPTRTRRKPKTKILSIEFKGEYLLMLQQIQDSAEPFLLSLKASGELPYQCFSDLMTDVTRFLVKQKEKSISDEPGASPDGYHSAIVLHILCCARDSLIHGCLESAISTIRVMQDKYNQDLGNHLTSLSQKLLENALELQKSKVYHPKMSAIMYHLHKQLSRKHSSPDLHSEQKILVILKRDLPSLKECLIDVLCTISSVKAKYQQDCDSEPVMQSLDANNCLILLGAQIKSDFPWSQFSFVVEYEKDDETFEELCTRQNIRYLSFKIKRDTIADETEIGNDMQQAKSSSPVEKNPLSVIGSAKITGNTQLLQLLETRHNLIIIERNYSFYVEDIPFPDIDVNETTCIVLSHLEQFCQTSNVEPLVRYIVKLSNKYESCWILVHALDQSKRYPFSGNTTESLQRLCATLDNFTTSMPCFDAKVMICTSVAETAELVRRVCDISMKSTPTLTEKDHHLRPWLTESMTPTELLLLHFPSINSISAMIMASKMSVHELFQKDVLHLSKAFPTIPVKFLKSYVDLVQSSDSTIPRIQCLDANSQETYTDTETQERTLDVSIEEDTSQLLQEVDNATLQSNQLDKMSEGSRSHESLPSPLSDTVRNIWPGIDQSEGKDNKNPLDNSATYPFNRSLDSQFHNDTGIESELFDKTSGDALSRKSVESVSDGSNTITKEMEARVIQQFIEREKRKAGDKKVPDYVESLEKLIEKQQCVDNEEQTMEGISKHNTNENSDACNLPEFINNDENYVNSFLETASENKNFNSNLKETTRNILKQASNKNIPTPILTAPLQKRNIGLAQPQRRMLLPISNSKIQNLPRIEQGRFTVKKIHQGIEGRKELEIYNGNTTVGNQAEIPLMPNQRQRSCSDVLLHPHTLCNPSTDVGHPNFATDHPQIHPCECHQMSALQMLHGQCQTMENARYGMHCCNRSWMMPMGLHAPPAGFIQQNVSYGNNQQLNVNPAYGNNQQLNVNPALATQQPTLHQQIQKFSATFNYSTTGDQDNRMMRSQSNWEEPRGQGRRTLWNNYDSPPMDLDDQDEVSPISIKSSYQAKETINRKTFCSTPRINPKKLKYKKDPYSKGGQTKLVFSR